MTLFFTLLMLAIIVASAVCLWRLERREAALRESLRRKVGEWETLCRLADRDAKYAEAEAEFWRARTRRAEGQP